MSKDEKLKLGLSFVYDAPPGYKGFENLNLRNSLDETMTRLWLLAGLIVPIPN